MAELQGLYQNAFAKLNYAKTNKTVFDNATNDRHHEFENLKALSTKIINAFIVSGADNLAVADLKSINNKIQGTRKKTKNGSTEKETEDNTAKTTKETIAAKVLETIRTISTLQQSYDRLIDDFTNLIQVLVQNKFYNPNENELKIAALQTKKENLQATNSSLIKTYTAYSNTLIQRNQTPIAWICTRNFSQTDEVIRAHSNYSKSSIKTINLLSIYKNKNYNFLRL